MTKEEFGKVLDVLMDVDGGCPDCVFWAVEDFMERFPEYDIAFMKRELIKRKIPKPYFENFGRLDWEDVNAAPEFSETVEKEILASK